DFERWREHVRKIAGPLYPANVRLVRSQEELRENLGVAAAVIVESLKIGVEELGLAPGLKAVQKYGLLFRNLDVAACETRRIRVLGVRRRANVACAEHAFALMLSLARKLGDLSGLISADQLPDDKLPYRPFDRRHTPGANWGRFSGTQTLFGSTMGIIGLGEIGREIATRAAAFGMRPVYYQRTRLPEAEENKIGAAYRPLETLLAESDWIVPQLPLDEST